MVDIQLSDAEKTFIIHGVQVNTKKHIVIYFRDLLKLLKDMVPNLRSQNCQNKFILKEQTYGGI